MSIEEPGSCKENGLFGFISKLLGHSTSEGTSPELSEEEIAGFSAEIREELRRSEEEQQSSLWDDKSELYAQPLEKKGLTADPSAAYGLFGFMGALYDKNGKFDENGNPLTLKLTGKFPKAQYMSLQIYRGKPFQTSEDVGSAIPGSSVLSDYEIVPKPGGKNPFRTGNREDTGEYEIIITPDKNKENEPNHIYYEPKKSPSDKAVITGFYRVYLPEGQEITTAELPKITAVDSDGDSIKAKYVELVKSWYLHLPAVKPFTNEVTPELKSLPWVNLDCVVQSNPSGLGSSHDLQYIGTFSKVPVGKYAVVKFRAPAVYFGRPQDVEDPAVRYWSFCSVYFPTLTTYNSLPCDPTKPEARDVTVIVGKDRPAARRQAQRLGAEFLPDMRQPDEDCLTLMLRNLLSTSAFKSQAYKGRFAPTGKVYSFSEFLDLPAPGDNG